MSPIDDATREELSALLDGALAADRAAELRRRLRDDEALRREYEALRRAVTAVRALPHAPAPPELRVRIDAAIGGHPPRAAVFRFGLLAAAASVVLAAGLAYFLRSGPSRSYEAKDAVHETNDRDGVLARRVAADEVGAERVDDALAPRPDEAPPGTRQNDGAAKETVDARPRVELHEEAAKGPLPGAVRALEEDEEIVIDAPAPGAPAGPAAVDAAKKRAENGRGGQSKPEAAAEQRGGAKAEETNLLRVVERQRRLATGTRERYLRELAALEPAKAREHVLAVFPADAAAGETFEAGRRGEREALDRDARGTPVLAAIVLADREEANLVTRILGAAPPAEGMSAAAGATFATTAKDQLATEIEGTPDELARIRRWLALVDLDRAATPPADAFVFGSTAKAKAPPKKVRAIVRLKYGPPPGAPAPAAPAGR